MINGSQRESLFSCDKSLKYICMYRIAWPADYTGGHNVVDFIKFLQLYKLQDFFFPLN